MTEWKTGPVVSTSVVAARRHHGLRSEKRNIGATIPSAGGKPDVADETEVFHINLSLYKRRSSLRGAVVSC